MKSLSLFSIAAITLLSFSVATPTYSEEAQTSIFSNFGTIRAGLNAVDSQKLMDNLNDATVIPPPAESVEYAKVFAASPLSVSCWRLRNAPATQCQVSLDWSSSGVEQSDTQMVAHLSSEKSKTLSDALVLPFRTSPGIGEVKHFATSDNRVSIHCQISETTPEQTAPQCYVAISRK